MDERPVRSIVHAWSNSVVVADNVLTELCRRADRRKDLLWPLPARPSRFASRRTREGKSEPERLLQEVSPLPMTSSFPFKAKRPADGGREQDDGVRVLLSAPMLVIISYSIGTRTTAGVCMGSRSFFMTRTGGVRGRVISARSRRSSMVFFLQAVVHLTTSDGNSGRHSNCAPRDGRVKETGR